MHPFPPRRDLEFLVGETLSQICLNPFSLDFAFENGSAITAEYSVEYVSSDGISSRHDIQKQLAPEPVRFHRCIGKTVTDIAVSDLRLSVKFGGGDVLHIETDLGRYESGQIRSGARSGENPVYIVF
jgi:hypothetical protein